MDSAQKIGKAFYESLAPPPELTVWEWADKYRILSSEASSEPGPWRTERFPFLKEVMDVMSPQNPAREIVGMKGSQIGFTETFLNFIGYTIHHDPNPMLYIQKTEKAVERFSTQRFEKSLLKTPEVFNKLPTQKSRDDSNTKTLKSFPGGVLILGGANSAASLRSMPICKLMLDELDSFEVDIQEEGDPIKLAIRRTTNFPKRKILYASTPLVKETSKIEPLYISGDQREFYVPCPFCGFPQTIRWSKIVYVDKNPKTAKMKCEKCGKLIDERFKTKMLSEGKWVAAYPGRDIISFFINAFYSPLGFFSWADAVKDWLEYRRSGNTELLRVIVNTIFAETYSESNKSIEFSSFDSRLESYKSEVPGDVYVLTAGVDVQEDRLECEIVGWGPNQESFSIDYIRIMGDTEFDAVWQQLDDHLKKSWKHESGAKLFPACVGIDSGHRAKIVYNFCKGREFRRIFPVKGAPGWGKGLINRPTKRLKEGVYLFLAYADELKSKVYSQLKAEKNQQGFCHFPRKEMYNRDYFRMLVSEKLVRKRVANKYKMVWELPAGRRNESLDARCYAIAALNILNPNFEAIKRRGTPMNLAFRKLKKKRRLISKGVEA